MRQTLKTLVPALILLFAGFSAFAQVTTSSFGGHVTDKEGAVVGATVIAVYQPTAATYYSVTDKNGNFRINNVTPGGPYTVTVQMMGYRTIENQNLYAPLGETLTVDAVLEDDSISLEAAVFVADGSLSNMNIHRSGAGTSVSQNTMRNLPTVSRSLNDVMKLTPQASTTSNGLAVGGGNYRSSYVTVDGAAFNNAFGIGSNLPAGGAPISLDAIEQMSVNITPFDVRLSGFTGGAINAVTKSGTNEFHASVYDYYTSQAVRGYKIEGENLNRTDFLDNTVGFTVGGPIVKNKLFFFVNAEYSSDVVPGSSKVVSTASGRVDPAFVPNKDVVRPTENFMKEVLEYLDNTYGYNPGRYQGYSISTPDYKIMARLDWNINDNNKLNLRFSHTHNSSASNPSNSISPMASSVYNRNTYGRTSTYAQYFESSRYNTDMNFTSVAAELNSRLFEGRGANMFRATWSHQNEPRSFVGANFPTVDILEPLEDGTKAVLTSFGPDPFTYGNLRDVHTLVVTDELSYTAGKHNLVAGLQYEYDNTKNGYMQGGLGFYVYNSWEDFKAAGKPAAFAVTHSNRDDLAQVFPSFNYNQISAYIQDEIDFSDYFKLTLGLRAELPFYPAIQGNDNAEFRTLANNSQSMKGLSTANMPKARLNLSPRVGFNWDVLKNRKLVIRGGSGLYTGRIPFVWIVSVAGNSNNLQAQFIDNTGTNPNTPSFHANLNDILTDLYGGQFKAQNLAAPTGATIIDTNLHMPTTWKSSLAIDAELPWGIKGSLEGIFNYDLSSVYAKRLGYTQDTVTLPGEPGSRAHWTSEGVKNSLGSTVSPYYLTNSNLHGTYYSITASLSKSFPFGLNLMAAYTRSGSRSIQEGYGDQVSSLFSGGNYSVNGSNVPELGHSAYVSPNRVIANVSYRIQEGRHFATTLGLFYEGYNHCYVGGYSYTRYSYTLKSDVTGVGGSYNLIYIPTDADLAKMEFSDDANKAEFKKFIEEDSYLSTHRGQYSERGAKVAPWMNRFNLKIAQDFIFNIANKPTTLQIGVDINNVANLLNSNWGLCKQVSTENILAYSGGKYTFSAPTVQTYRSTYNTWQMLFSVRLFF
ncbi:MAG: TonB-dependent receptor [Bacteroidales bacterium]|nr:TonB-dependent receptor [Bacteroidales bacterium]